MKALIIDNEEELRDGLKKLLQIYCPQVNMIHEANGVQAGLEAIIQHSPQVVFLDMEMGDGTGVDLLNQLKTYNFQLIFITAFDKYAVDAFKFSAIDFLLKPIDPEDLIDAITKAQNNIHNQDLQKQLQVLYEGMSSMRTHEKKIVLRDNESIHFIRIQDIIRCEADGPYTKFYVTNSSPILISKSLKEYDETLTPFGFIRCHHSHLVNASKILRFDKIDGGELILDNKDMVPVSHRKKDQVLTYLANV
jgi:two-component system LytT family response regulator